MRLVKRLFLFLLVVFVAPALAAIAWWQLGEHPSSWRDADWSSSGLLAEPQDDPEAAIYVMAARTGGLKGALSVHSWIVTKAAGASSYQRYDKVGWGSPVRRNGYPADARWYSNLPTVVRKISGGEAERLIPKVEAAIAAYPYGRPGDYRIWPGPNSNSFVAHVLAAVPELGAKMPSNATGRDFAPGFASVAWLPGTRDLHATLGGYLGFSAGITSGLEMHFLGLVAGVDITEPGLKIPAFGTVSLSGVAQAATGGDGDTAE
ncbi:DUF3750 domain-containing protein [Kumtagia ephedrae]|uniref:DUF3750 domain-containing protein n=1 Tax=Kumtagia ephedrae TaxID=2116701 RepID=A0A2P7RVW6_9HYPH|nr:DUF3750 domain-containing protein [Mesorhizobium ephedrae]PSJ54346.1 DUF3750 domain-containing protein [Mesorhizobium ephedrae]